MSYLQEQAAQLEKELGIFVYYNRNVSTKNSTTYTCVLSPESFKQLGHDSSDPLYISSAEWFSRYSYYAVKPDEALPSSPHRLQRLPTTPEMPDCPASGKPSPAPSPPPDASPPPSLPKTYSSDSAVNARAVHLQLEECVSDGVSVDVTVVPKTSSEDSLAILSTLLAASSSSPSRRTPPPQQQRAQDAGKRSLFDYLEELDIIANGASFMGARLGMRSIGGPHVGKRFVQLLSRGEFCEETIKAFLALILVSAHHNEDAAAEEAFYDPCADDIGGNTFVNPHIQPLLKVIEGPSCFYMISPTIEVDLQVVLSSCQKLFRNVTDRLFLCYQLVQALKGLHNAGICHGNLTPRCIGFEYKLPWVRLCSFGFPTGSSDHPSKSIGEELWDALQRWRHKLIGNFDYLMILNSVAGRRFGDPNFHPVVPWIIDFRSPTSFRDLSKSKFRLTKGDDQLDQTFTSDEPHHITNLLTDLTYYSYKARCTPISVLKRFVRFQFVAKEYPESVERMYRWSPDEAIPEFYTDPSVFKSVHPNMPDLQVPAWAGCQVMKFLKMHRELMESDYVSSNLHLWIDLTFGYQLSGAAAVAAKNVPLNTSRHVGGFVQLFPHPHPTRFEVIAQPQEAWASQLVSSEVKAEEMIAEFLSPESFPLSVPAPPLIVHTASPDHLHFSSSSRALDSPSAKPAQSSSLVEAGDRSLPKSGTAFERLRARIGSMRTKDKTPPLGAVSTNPQFREVAAKDFHLSAELPTNLLSVSMLPPSGAALMEHHARSRAATTEFATLDRCDGSDSCSGSEEEEGIVSSHLAHASKSAPSLHLNDQGSDSDSSAEARHDNPITDFLESFGSGLSFPLPKDPTSTSSPASLVPVRTTHGSVRDLWESPIAALLGTESSLSERRNFLRLIPSYVLPLQLVSRITNGYVRGVANDTFSLGILISHIMSGTMLVDAASVESWSPSLGYSLPDSISRRLNLLPSSSIRGFIESLLSHSYDGVDNILSEHIDCFPSWFEKVHTILSMYYMLPSWIDRVAYSLQLTSSLNGIPTPAIQLLMPHFQPLFQRSDTRLMAVDLLSALAEVIGDVQLCHEYFSSSLITMLDQIADVGLQQKILSASFLQTLPGKFGMVWFLDFIIPHLINALFAPVQSVADVACNSLTRLTPLLGPVIAMRRLLMHIIALLTRPQTTVVVRAIIGISTHLGTDMIVQHIIPQLYHLLQEHSSRVSKGPRVLLSVLSTLSELLELLDRPSALQVFVIKSSLLFSCFLNPSPQSCESSQPSLIRFLAKLSSYIGPSHTKAHILPYISQYLTNYDGLYSKRGAWIGRDTDQVLKSIYSIQIASLIYAEFTPLIDRQTLLDEIPNFQNIESMIHVNQRNNAPVLGSSNLLLKTTRFEEAPASRNNPSSAGPLGSASVGSRGSLQLISMPQLESFSSPQMGGDLPESFAHLKWTTSLPYSDFPKKFCGKVAAVLRGGHTGGIRAMAHYNEQHMLTGSRDHTVRWWTIDDPRSAKRVYSKHKQAVQSVHFLDGGRLALSTAGSIHLWNPETLASVHTFNPDPDPFVCTVPFHSNSIQLIGCSSSSLHAIDPLCQSYRLNAFQNVWSLDSQNSGQIRCVARVPSINAVATGSSTGYITLIDMRTGIILFSWKGHDGAVLSLDAQESRLVSSSADRTLAAWNLLLSPPKLELARWGHSDAVSAFTFYDHQTLLSTSGSKLGLTSLSPNQALNRIAKVSKIPLFNAKAEKITALMSLPSHGVVVMGTDDGAIRIGY